MKKFFLCAVVILMVNGVAYAHTNELVGVVNEGGTSGPGIMAIYQGWMQLKNWGLASFGGTCLSVAVGDAENDGLNEIAFTIREPNGSVYLYMGRYNGTTFVGVHGWSIYNFGTANTMIAIGDIDNDGDNELVTVTSPITAAPVVTIYDYDGVSMSIVDTVNIPFVSTGQGVGGVSIGDADNRDGDNELGILINEGGTSGNAVLGIYDYDGIGLTLRKHGSASFGGTGLSVAIGDADNYGLNEIAFTIREPWGTVYLYMGRYDGIDNFAVVHGWSILNWGGMNTVIAIGDADSDYLVDWNAGYTAGVAAHANDYQNGFTAGYAAGEAAHANDYQNGYNAGNTAGYTVGHEAGYTEGHEAGYAAGEAAHANDYQNGYNAGNTAGYTEGHEAGYAEGEAAHANDYQNGFTAGYAAGEAAHANDYQNGYNAGYAVGYGEGYTAGYSAGFSDGWNELLAKLPPGIRNALDKGLAEGGKTGFSK